MRLGEFSLWVDTSTTSPPHPRKECLDTRSLVWYIFGMTYLRRTLILLLLLSACSRPPEIVSPEAEISCYPIIELNCMWTVGGGDLPDNIICDTFETEQIICSDGYRQIPVAVKGNLP